jgi:hypothetical protein
VFCSSINSSLVQNWNVLSVFSTHMFLCNWTSSFSDIWLSNLSSSSCYLTWDLVCTALQWLSTSISKSTFLLPEKVFVNVSLFSFLPTSWGSYSLIQFPDLKRAHLKQEPK